MLKIKREALLVFLLLSITYAYFFQEPGWNGRSRLALTAAIVREGRLTIDTFHDSEISGFKTGDKSFYDGHYYTDKAIGSSLAAAVFYYPMHLWEQVSGQALSPWLMKYLLTFLVVGLSSALAGCLIYVNSEFIAGNKLFAFTVTLAISLGTMSFPFSVVFYGHQLAGALLFIGFFLIFQLKLAPNLKSSSGLIFYSHLLLIGFLLGFALITELTTVLIVFPLILYYFFLLHKKGLLGRWALVGIPAIGGFIPLAILMAYNLQSYNQPFVSGYQFLDNPFYREAMSHGIMGIGFPRLSVLFYETLHPAQGLFWQSPVLILAMIGFYFMIRYRQYRIECLLVAGIFASYLLVNSGYFLWWGGFSFGPRLIIPALLFLSLPLAFIPRRALPILILLSVISIFQMMVVAASTIQVPDDAFQSIAGHNFFEFSAIYSYSLNQLVNGEFTWNLGQFLFNLQDWASLLPIILAIIGMTIWMAYHSARSGTNPSRLRGTFP